MCSPPFIRAWAAWAEAKGNVRSITGLILPASISGHTSRSSASRIAPFSSLERERRVVAASVSRFVSIGAKFTVALAPDW